MLRYLMLASCVAVTAACSSNGGNPLPNGSDDSGVVFNTDSGPGPGEDAGMGTDASEPADASMAPDAGMGEDAHGGLDGSVGSGDAGTRPDAGQTDAGPEQTDAGGDAGTVAPPDAGPGGANCQAVLTCSNACTTSACASGCLEEGGPQAQQEYATLVSCLFGTACPSTGGGICDSTASGYNSTNCNNCLASAQASGGTCYSDLVACLGSVPDAGPSLDGGSNVQLGGNCVNPGTGTPVQSSCATGLYCYAVTSAAPLNMCTKACTTDASCGYHGSDPNYCVGGICFLGCDTSGSVTCGRSDFTCQSLGIATQGLCTPDCTQLPADYCASQYFYPYNECDNLTGDPNYGGCVLDGYPNVGDECVQSSSCPSGDACAAIPGQTGTDVCVASCSLGTMVSCSANADCESGYCLSGECQSCPLGYSCNPSTGTCALQTVSDYSPCVSEVQCPSTDLCIDDVAPTPEGPTPGHCYTLCPNTACATGQTCVQLEAGLSICLYQCTMSASCPSTTTCQNNYCLP
jgi:hypothetical protein